MKIELKDHYQNVNRVKLAPGIHDVNATLAKYLVETGHAEYVDNPVETDESMPDDEPVDPDSRDAIKAALDEAGIPYNKNAHTETLYALLETHSQDNE